MQRIEARAHFSAEDIYVGIDPLEAPVHVRAQIAYRDIASLDGGIGSLESLVNLLTQIVQSLVGPAHSDRLHAPIVPRPDATVARAMSKK